MQGRGSATHDELVAATYVASELRQYGVEPAGDNGSYIQHVPTMQRQFVSPPQLRITPPGSTEPITWDYGKDFLAVFLTQTEFSGPLRRLDADKFSDETNPRVEPGTVVLVTGSDENKVKQAAFALVSAGAAAVLMPAGESQLKRFDEAGDQLPKLPDRLDRNPGEMNFNVLSLNRGAFRALEKMTEGATVNFDGQSSEETGSTWNAVGILRGSDPSLQHAAILFSAHLDHLGIGAPVNGDNIYNGADDDASGTTAVLEIARVLGRGQRPRRTVIFALFGSEEMGGLGSSYFREHPPLPLRDIAANLEFEMIGRPDPAVKDDTLWLTGWERSNLGPALAAHGARLVRDPAPGGELFCALGQFRSGEEGRRGADRIKLWLAPRLSPAQRRSGSSGFQAHGRRDWIAAGAAGVAGEFGLPTEVECRRKAVAGVAPMETGRPRPVERATTPVAR